MVGVHYPQQLLPQHQELTLVLESFGEAGAGGHSLHSGLVLGIDKAPEAPVPEVKRLGQLLQEGSCNMPLLQGAEPGTFQSSKY